MGYYINEDSKGNTLPENGKAMSLINDGAKQVLPIWQDNLICVVENGWMDAAGYAFSEKEYRVFNTPDGRNKVWIVHPEAKRLAGYNK